MLRGSKSLSSRGFPAVAASAGAKLNLPVEILPAAKSTPALFNNRRLPIAPMNPPRQKPAAAFRSFFYIVYFPLSKCDKSAAALKARVGFVERRERSRSEERRVGKECRGRRA